MLLYILTSEAGADDPSAFDEYDTGYIDGLMLRDVTLLYI